MGRYVPSNIGQIRDRLGAMVLCMPDMELPNSGLGFDAAYEQLEHSLGLVKAELGEARYHRLVDMARESKRKFGEGDIRSGCFLLQDMRKLIGRSR